MSAEYIVNACQHTICLTLEIQTDMLLVVDYYKQYQHLQRGIKLCQLEYQHAALTGISSLSIHLQSNGLLEYAMQVINFSARTVNMYSVTDLHQ